MDRSERSAKLDHLRTDDRRLQPGPVVESGVPITDRGMKLAKRDLEVVVIVETDKRTFYIQFVSVRLCREGHLAEVADLPRKRRNKMQVQLPHGEAARGFLLVRRLEINIAESPDLQGRVMDLCLTDFRCAGSVLGVRRLAGACGSLRRWVISRGRQRRVAGLSRQFFAFAFFEFADPLLHLLDTLQQALDGRFRLGCLARGLRQQGWACQPQQENYE